MLHGYCSADAVATTRVSYINLTEASFTVTESSRDDGIEMFSVIMGYGVVAMWHLSTAQTVFGNPAV